MQSKAAHLLGSDRRTRSGMAFARAHIVENLRQQGSVCADLPALPCFASPRRPVMRRALHCNEMRCGLRLAHAVLRRSQRDRNEGETHAGPQRAREGYRKGRGRELEGDARANAGTNRCRLYGGNSNDVERSTHAFGRASEVKGRAVVRTRGKTILSVSDLAGSTRPSSAGSGAPRRARASPCRSPRVRARRGRRKS